MARRFADVQALASVGSTITRKLINIETQQLQAHVATSSILNPSRLQAALSRDAHGEEPVEPSTSKANKDYEVLQTSPGTKNALPSPSPSSLQESTRRTTLTHATSATPVNKSADFASRIVETFPSIDVAIGTPISSLFESGSAILGISSSKSGSARSKAKAGAIEDQAYSSDQPPNRDAYEALIRESKWLDSMSAEDITGLNRRGGVGQCMAIGLVDDLRLVKTLTPYLHVYEDSTTFMSPTPSPAVSSTLPLPPSTDLTATTTYPTTERILYGGAESPVREVLIEKAANLMTPSVQSSTDPSPVSSIPTPEQIDSEQRRQNLTEASMPTSRIARVLHYGGLAASLGVGAITETVRRSVGRGTGSQDSPAFLSEGNVDRLVNKLTKMRGAALKLGQMISIQDNKMVPPEIEQILLRVQNSANFMPQKQMRKVMEDTMGANWESEFSDFDMTPIAAASIGQVHQATHRATGLPVAVKIQYPGVAASIDSDLANLKTIVLMSSILPRGMYLDNTLKVARRELAWETDYLREADCIEQFGEYLKDDQDFQVPRLIREASGPMVLTMEWMKGETMMQAMALRDQAARDRIGTNILGLCLRELFEFQYMQTDPNWTNFLYNPMTTKIELLDFGATRSFEKRFTTLYLQILLSGAAGDREGCLQYSRQLGFLTGEETEEMETAHINSILTLAEPFHPSAPDVYDFQHQTITQRVKDEIPTMLRHRLTPPPDETYSLHRKMAGAFLLCAKLGSRVETKKLFSEITSRYEK